MDELREEQESFRAAVENKRERDTLNRKGGMKPKVAPTPTLIRPFDPENINLSKAQFLAKRRKDNERRAKIAAFEKQLDDEAGLTEAVTPVHMKPPVVKNEEVDESGEHTLQAPKKLGRPKKDLA